MRQIGVNEISKFIARQYKTNVKRALFFWGPPGVGKTEETVAVTRELGLGFAEIRLGTLVPSDLRGIPVPDEAERVTRWLVAEFLPTVEKNGERGILLLDEYPQATPTMQGLAQRLVHERRIGDHYKLPDGWMVVALGNRREDKASVYEMPAQTQNRFKHFLVMPDIKSFTEYAMKNDFHPHIISFLNANESYLHMFDPQAKGAMAWPSPRSWAAANEDYKLEEDPLDLEQSVGTRAMDQFMAFREVFSSLPDIDAILAGKGQNEQMPRERNGKFALITTLASRMETAEHGFNSYRWLTEKKLDDEMVFVFLEYIVQRAQNKNQQGVLATMISKDPLLGEKLKELMSTLTHV